MKAMVLHEVGKPLELAERPDPEPQSGELLVRVEACAICRTDLHVVEGDLANPKLPLVPGHEIVGIVEAVGQGVSPHRIGSRVGIPWLGHTCGHCSYCRSNAENLCDEPLFTGYTRDGGFATHVVADSAYAFDLPQEADPVSLTPLLCAGLIGWRSLKKAGEGKKIGLYGFGAAAHIIAQVCVWQGRQVYAFTRPDDRQAQTFALSLGATWAGGSDETPPAVLDTAIIFAPVGDLVPLALKAIRKGGRVICGGIHMSDIPQMPYALLWGERKVASVANLTRDDAMEFFPIAAAANVKTHTVVYPLAEANKALDDLRGGRLSGAAVLVP
ncbi:propanol-preferring alcohol dehydrogenase [Rhizobium petrolearium]|uniref:zinc-dependent alcohol dehydrogenase family protein n=1 Tax=Neorhizobium petrolearium TaxID=515361 RepID=UPI001AE8D87F|nr:zinc-dependent alcohol dehydrogenase family protein [Neorhizobium petrolearium]MBP1843300.1 propanol-preferring alcohol dehydrogenase [Neorhizobium petrolearium]